MKVNDQYNLSVLSNYLREVEGTAGDKAKDRVRPDDKRVGQTDKVTISGRSKEIMKARQIIDGVSVVRKGKVEVLKPAVENHTYNVKGRDIASSLIKRSLVDTLL